MCVSAQADIYLHGRSLLPILHDATTRTLPHVLHIIRHIMHRQTHTHTSTQAHTHTRTHTAQACSTKAISTLAYLGTDLLYEGDLVERVGLLSARAPLTEQGRRGVLDGSAPEV
jgi:hypothetical protein